MDTDEPSVASAPDGGPDERDADWRLVCDLRGFIADLALADEDGERLISALGQRLRAGGVPVSRLSVAWRTLDPLIYAHQIIWTAAVIETGDFPHVEVDARPYRDTNPLRYIVEHQLDLYRHDLTLPAHPYPMLDELAAAGHTEYVGGVESFSSLHVDSGPLRGVFISACADAPGGFGAHIGVFSAIKPTLALAFRAIIEQRLALAVARTYLGRLAAERVLAGSIRRGDAEVIPAAIWYSDMRSFTPMSEALPLDDTIHFLNEVFEATAGAVDHAGGHVLDFIGDAVLAVFPLADDGVLRALAALDDALARLDSLRERHRDDPRAAIAQTLAGGLVGIALAVGDVRFGNIGTAARLAFSVIGPTVNMVARIEALTKVLGEPVLVQRAFAEASGREWRSCGLVELVGVNGAQELFGLGARRQARRD